MSLFFAKIEDGTHIRQFLTRADDSFDALMQISEQSIEPVVNEKMHTYCTNNGMTCGGCGLHPQLRSN